MNILLLGQGGREHAIAWKLAQSKQLTKLFIAPGNAGTVQCGTNVDINPLDFAAIKDFVLAQQITMVVVGPEEPLVKGIVDFFTADAQLKNIAVIGPAANGAQLEGSKDFAKQFMQRHGIPTARYQTFTKNDVQQGYAFLQSLKPPYVLKADGLAAGKGVLIIDALEQAKAELHALLTDNRFGAAANKVVIEEFLHGVEMSVFVLTDGSSYKILPNAKDYKRIGENDTGPNTGGMGAVSPVPFANEALMQKIEQKIIVPTVNGIKNDNLTYCGFIFIGLMVAHAGTPAAEPYVIEYNCRMGDPETEVVMPRIKSDLLELFIAIAEKRLDACAVEIDDQSAVTVMLVSGGYPDVYEKGKTIEGLQKPTASLLFHAGTKTQNQNTVTNGGRVLAVTSLAPITKDALHMSYHSIKNIAFDAVYFRKDIGNDLEKFF